MAVGQENFEPDDVKIMFSEVLRNNSLMLMYEERGLGFVLTLWFT